MSRPIERRSPHLRAPWLRRIGPAALATVLLAASLGACVQQAGPVDSGVTVLGVYEFEIEGIGTETATATVRRLDAPTDAARSELGTTPVQGVTISGASTGSTVIDDVVYVHQSVVVHNGTGGDLTGLTFMAYSGAPWFPLDGTAIRVLEDANGAPIANLADQVTPTIGTIPSAVGDDLVLDAPTRASLATVVYTEAELDTLRATLTEDFAFVDTVLPYGFVATSDDLLDRTIPDAGTGRLNIGFRIPDASANRIVWRAVAVIDDELRVALPAEYNTPRTVDGTDNLVSFLEHAHAIARANGDQAIDGIVMGSGDRALVGFDASDLHDGDNVVDLSTLQPRVIDDVRLAGDTGSAFWIGGGSANTSSDSFGDVFVSFTATGSYDFTPSTDDVSVHYLIVGGGGAGGSPAASNQGGGGGGAGGFLTNTAGARTPIDGVCGLLPCFVSVGAGGDPSAASVGASGGNSAFGTFQANGGGGGGIANVPGVAGGSGGGGGGSAAGGSATAGQGNVGGASNNINRGGGGGGASVQGQLADFNAGPGGGGSANSITGAAVSYAGGGGGGSSFGNGATGGTGGGGTGAGSFGPAQAAPGGSNTGGGGGGGFNAILGAAGGSGVVVIRYEVP